MCSENTCNLISEIFHAYLHVRHILNTYLHTPGLMITACHLTISGQFYMLSGQYTLNCLGISSSLELSGPLVCVHRCIIGNANFCECQLKFGMVWHCVRIKTKSYHKPCNIKSHLESSTHNFQLTYKHETNFNACYHAYTCTCTCTCTYRVFPRIVE